ncbi:hypothetical protein JCM10450v2_007150 [Rhodotorula kratochvilovae]
MDRLPTAVLVHTFFLASGVDKSDPPSWQDEREEDVRGGSLASWRSNEVLRSVGLVCRAWRSAAETAFYRSVHLDSASSASLFCRTLDSKASLAGKVKYLSIGFSTAPSVASTRPDTLRSASQQLVGILARCTALVALQLRPLHTSVADDLFLALNPSASTLEIVVVGPRYFRLEGDGADMLPFTSRSIELVVRQLPRLRIFEIDCWAAGLGETRWRGLPNEAPSTLRLAKLSVKADVDDEVLEGLLGECVNLETLDVYVEKDVRRDPNLASSSIFRHLPSSLSLHTLILQDLAPPSASAGHFHFSPSLLDDLRNPALGAIDALRLVALQDAHDGWSDDRVGSVRSALRERGVKFRFAAAGEGSSPAAVSEGSFSS